MYANKMLVYILNITKGVINKYKSKIGKKLLNM